MLDFICMDSAELLGTSRERKFKMKIYVSSGIRTQARYFSKGKPAVKTSKSKLVSFSIKVKVKVTLGH